MTQTEIATYSIIERWHGSIANLNKSLHELNDVQLQNEIAPNKNRGTYLLGHLIAVHDDMLILLGMGDKLFPELHEPFIKQSDKTATNIPSPPVLREMWATQHRYIQERFAQLTSNEWFEKHTAVTAEDFAKEPHRNKLNIVITRTSHLQYHTGQIALLKP
jgi:DinB superfamily